MRTLKRLIEKVSSGNPVRVAGLMSGTSADGIDVAVVDIEGRTVRLVAFDTFAYPRALRAKVLSLCRIESSSVEKICHYNYVLGEAFAKALIDLCRITEIKLNSIHLIGSHGQTIYHNPKGKRHAGKAIGSTLQIGEPSVIAEQTGITTVADFRCRDMAAGGQGAPLVPYADYFLFRHRRLSRAIQNIGGIANVTFLPAACRSSDVIAFDTGPGNMIIDGVMGIVTNGKSRYDRDGAMARRGTVNKELLRQMLKHPFLRRRPPKSTGREQFGGDYCEQFYKKAREMSLTSEDTVATATAFTARSVAHAYSKFLTAVPDEMILCGGGAHNSILIGMLQQELQGVRITSTNEFGISVDAKEAVSFAILALATLQSRCNNMPSATGAERPVVLGKIVPA